MISVIIPLAPNECKWHELVSQLKELPDGSEIILVVGIGEKIDTGENEYIRVVEGRSGRAGRMNSGVDQARNELIWFLHADTKLAEDTSYKTVEALQTNAEVLTYSDLRFLDDGPRLTRLNEWMVRWRSDCLRMPFGDQGFAISKMLFQEMGGYREDVAYGEDYVFTWKLKQEGKSIRRTGADIYTSARKYQKGGWGSVTALHVALTFKQGWPEFWIWVRKRFL